MPVPVADDLAVYGLDWRVDVPIVVGMGGYSAATPFFDQGQMWTVEPAALPELNALDELVVAPLLQAYIDADPGPGSARTASDVLAGAVVGMPVGMALVAGVARQAPWRAELYTGAVIAAESGLSAFAITDVVKRAVLRPRPFVYACGGWVDCAYTHDQTLRIDWMDSQPYLTEDARHSFFSAHTSVVAATSFSLAHLYSTSVAGPNWLGGATPYLLAGGLTVTTGILRVEAGMHFPTDVLVGGVVGAGIGLLATELHRVRAPADVSFSLTGCEAGGDWLPCAAAAGTW